MTEFNKALNYAFILLKYRPRAKKELILRLKKRKFPLDIIEKVIDYLEEHNYINDREFCSLYIASLLEKGYGKKRIEFNLNRFGIEKDLIKELLENQSYEFKLEELIKKKLDFYKNKKDRLIRLLLSRGYELDEIKDSLRKFNLNYEDE